jgi:hypothetical protein
MPAVVSPSASPGEKRSCKRLSLRVASECSKVLIPSFSPEKVTVMAGAVTFSCTGFPAFR